MGRSDDQLARMISLMNYNSLVVESEDKKGSIEYSKTASNGKSYAIIRECNKHYIKVADADKANVCEAYDYIGGFNNKKDYEYPSYESALKNFDFKMMSINEAYGNKVNPESLNPTKKQDFVIEGTDSMRREIARQRQIMENACKIGCQEDPEKVAGSNDPDTPFNEKAEAKLDKDMPKASEKPEKMGAPYGENEKAQAPKDVKNEVMSDGVAVATEHPKGGKVNESCDCDSASCNCDWGSEGIGKGNGDPKSNGWEIEGQTTVNEAEDAEDDDKNLLVDGGENSEDDSNEIQPDDFEIEDGEDESNEDDIIDGDTEEEEDADIDDEEVPVDDDSEVEDEMEFDDEDSLELDVEDRLQELEDEIAGIKAELGLDSDEEDLDMPEEDGDEEDVEVEDEPDFDEGEDNDMEFELSDDEEENPEEFEDEMEPSDDEEFEYEDEDEDEIDECGYLKEAFMQKIVDSVINEVLNEEVTTLHDFGKHPGFRKKPMSLPQTGSDNEKGMRDWNDDSVHNEKPFASAIGNGDPYNKAVNMITDSVLEALKKKI